MKFRKLTADEIEVRVSMVKKAGVSLLLYKDARCDMRILDETVGAENWTRSHELINGNLFCNVGIKVQKGVNGRDFDEWVFKQDVGVESYTEKEKGQASDSFKRACFNWGIGRELYTAPFIWIRVPECEIEYQNNKYVCRDNFKVTKIDYSEDGKINLLKIVNTKTNETCFAYGLNEEQRNLTGTKPQEQSKRFMSNEHYNQLKEALNDKHGSYKNEDALNELEMLCRERGIINMKQIPDEIAEEIIKEIKETPF